MLTKQHRFAQRIINPQHRQVYQTHMCGLCHSLGDNYGLLSRLLTSYEMTMLNMLTNAQDQEDAQMIMRRCPLNPLVKAETIRGTACKFTSAAAITLAHVSVVDDVQDSLGRNLVARFANWLLDKPYQVSLQVLSELGFETEAVMSLNERQAAAEQDKTQDPTVPSAMVSAKLFAMTACIAGNPRNEESLSIIGASYGTYLYLLDAFRDYPRDMVQGDYTPLRCFSEQLDNAFILRPEGIEWLLEKLTKIQDDINTHVDLLLLYHYQDVIKGLLCEPIKRFVLKLEKEAEDQQGLLFLRWQPVDVLNATALFLPIAVTSIGLAILLTNGDLISHIDLGQHPVTHAGPITDCTFTCLSIGDPCMHPEYGCCTENGITGEIGDVASDALCDGINTTCRVCQNPSECPL